MINFIILNLNLNYYHLKLNLFKINRLASFYFFINLLARIALLPIVNEVFLIWILCQNGKKSSLLSEKLLFICCWVFFHSNLELRIVHEFLRRILQNNILYFNIICSLYNFLNNDLFISPKINVYNYSIRLYFPILRQGDFIF